MTLNLFLVNSDQAIVLSDRRLIENGRLVNSEATKVATIVGLDGRSVMAFTGLARYGAFDASRWLLEAVGEAGRADRLISSAVGRLREALEAKVDSLGITKADDRRLSVTIAGYLYSSGVPVAHVWRLSNFEGDRLDVSEPRAAGEFVLAAARQTESRAVLAYPSGFDAAFTAEEQKAVVALLQERRPPAAIVGKASEVMRRIASDQSSRGWIGTDYTSAIVPGDPAQRISVDFHVGAPTRTVYMPSMVNLETGILMADPKVTQVSEGPWVVPKIGRNRPCSCGSGQKYKRCHGR